jgi:Zn-finger nucleic acid-binding protein
MLCPVCKIQSTTVKISLPNLSREIVVDQCPKCQGIWCDRYELYQIPTSQIPVLNHVNETPPTVSGTDPLPGLTCPRDGEPLTRLVDFNFPQNINIQRCHKCEGVWINLSDLIEYKSKLKPQSTSLEHPSDYDSKRYLEVGPYKVLTTLGGFFMPNYMSYVMPRQEEHPQFILDNAEVDLLKSVPANKKVEIYQTLANQFNQQVESENNFINTTINLISFILKFFK